MYSTVEGVYNGSGIHCENIYSQITRQHRLQEMTAEECSHHHQNLYSGTMHQPIAEREIPYAQFISTKNSTAACNIYVTNQQMKAGLFSYAGVKSDNPGQSGSNFSAGHARWAPGMSRPRMLFSSLKITSSADLTMLFSSLKITSSVDLTC